MPGWWNDLGDLSGWTGPTLYLVVFALVLVESGVPVGFLLPGDTVLFAAGLVSARPGSGISTVTMAAVVVVAAVLGDVLGYETGRRYGRPWLVRHVRGGTDGEPDPRLKRADDVVGRWGATSVIVCRFIPWLRTFVPILAGVGRMPFRAFMTANVVGALIWGAGLVTLGRVAHESQAVRYVAYAAAGTAVTASLVMALVGALRRRRAAAG